MSGIPPMVAIAIIAAMLSGWVACYAGAKRLRLAADTLRATQVLLAQHAAAQATAEQSYLKLLETMGAAVVRSTLSGVIQVANPCAVELLGFELNEQLVEQNFHSFFAEPARHEVALRRIVAEQRFKNIQAKLRRRDGSMLYVYMNGYVLPDAQGQPELIEFIMVDITELLTAREQRDRLEQELRLSQKLQAIGSMAAGIAHEINTPLQFVSDSVYVLKLSTQELQTLSDEYGQCLTELGNQSDKKSAAQPLLDHIKEVEEQIDVESCKRRITSAFERITEGVERVTRIVRAMKEFSHPDQQGRTRTDLNHALQTTLEVCRNEYKHLADVETDFGDIPAIVCQAGELNQTFVNLIVNAAHAIEKAQQTRPGKGVIRIATKAYDQVVEVNISDTGSGIPESIRHRIFDPFFTTKGIGKGTGQGLALARAVVVTRHGGEISVASTVGSGTTFTLRLPVEYSPTHSSDSSKPDRREAYA